MIIQVPSITARSIIFLKKGVTMSVNKSTFSPRLEVLRQALEAGNIEALDVFWQEVIEQGAPIIERIEGDDDHSLVTFLWRAKQIRSVAMISLLTNPTTYPMTRLLDTDLWYKTCSVRNDVRATYLFFLDDPSHPIEEGDDYGSRWANYQPDPFNPHTFVFTGIKLIRSVLELPATPAQPWLEPRDGTPKGKVEHHQIHSDILGNERRLWLYTPPGYTPDRDEAYGLLILFDGEAYVEHIPTPTILDNLLSAGHIPPVVAVLLDSLSFETRLRELLCHKPFNDFLVTEFMPWVRAHYHVTSDPKQTLVGGTSAGGLAAAYAGLEHSQLFGNILSQSGAFSWKPESEQEYEWMARQFASREKLPLRFYIDAGILEVNSLRDIGDAPNLLTANRHLRHVLRAKGYEVHYAEFSGGHDYISWQGTLADGLQALMGSTAA